MSNEVVGQEVEKKLPKEPKEPRLRKGLSVDNWSEKLAAMTVSEVPAGWLPMSKIVSEAKEVGIKVSRICTAMGGDRGLKEPWDPVFKIVYVGGRKFGSPEILTKGFDLLKDPEYHKSEHKGRPRLVPTDGKLQETVGGKKINLKPAAGMFNK